jgi:hypothetical protein
VNVGQAIEALEAAAKAHTLDPRDSPNPTLETLKRAAIAYAKAQAKARNNRDRWKVRKRLGQ